MHNDMYRICWLMYRDCCVVNGNFLTHFDDTTRVFRCSSFRCLVWRCCASRHNVELCCSVVCALCAFLAIAFEKIMCICHIVQFCNLHRRNLSGNTWFHVDWLWPPADRCRGPDYREEYTKKVAEAKAFLGTSTAVECTKSTSSCTRKRERVRSILKINATPKRINPYLWSRFSQALEVCVRFQSAAMATDFHRGIICEDASLLPLGCNAHLPDDPTSVLVHVASDIPMDTPVSNLFGTLACRLGHNFQWFRCKRGARCA